MPACPFVDDAILQSKNLIILAICQLISASGSITIVTLGGILGATLAPDPALATIPVSAMVIGVALMTIPATLVMRRLGRRRGFAVGSLCAVCATLCAAWSIQIGSFAVFILAIALLGVNMAFTQQYRYAAIESVSSEFAGRAVSTVLVGAIGGALLGSVILGIDLSWIDGAQFTSPFFILSALFLLQMGLLLSLDGFHAEPAEQRVESNASIRNIVRRPLFVVAVFSGIAAYGAMSFVMTGTPISMHINDGFSLDKTASVIRSHVIAMYAPSLFSGYLLDKLGKIRIMLAGAALLLLACVAGLLDRTYMHYWFALVLLGVGWNFLYVGATTTLALTYKSSERYTAQAINEFCVFGVAAAASLLAGVVIHFYGWKTFLVIPLPVIMLAIVGLVLVRKDALLISAKLQ